MTRLAWLKDHITQMGHPPQMYEKWNDEIKMIEAGMSCTATKRFKRRATAFRLAGITGDELPEGMVYEHGHVLSQLEARILGDQLAALGDLKPHRDKAGHRRLTDQYLKILRKLAAEGSNS